MQGLQLKLSPGAEYREQWNMEDLQVLERFFELRVMAIPFKPNAIHAFGRLLNAPFRILRDLIQVMKLELIPSFAQQYQLKWSVQFCLTVPPSAPYIVPIGSSSILTATNKLLFFLYIRWVFKPTAWNLSSNSKNIWIPKSFLKQSENYVSKIPKPELPPTECDIQEISTK